MKTKQILFLMCSLLLLFGVAGCDKNEAAPNELIGSWKLKGLGETVDNTLRELEPKDCEKCYTLSFHKDGQYFGWTASNSIAGNFSVDKKKLTISFSNLLMTEVGEWGDGDLYLDYFIKVQSYSLSKQELKLFYEDNKYLMYKKID